MGAVSRSALPAIDDKPLSPDTTSPDTLSAIRTLGVLRNNWTPGREGVAVTRKVHTLEALAFYLDLIAKPEDARVHEELRRMHAEIAHTDQVLKDGLCTLRAYFQARGCSVLADVAPAAVPKVALCPRSAPDL
jgi:hypothetical protein